ncbi:MAG: hypothetical protein P4L53_06245 [Candidatus Obscuribacterales bacterium]|nr:hypothetical protein [Candidatus Obscuribacterales bacterium]
MRKLKSLVFSIALVVLCCTQIAYAESTEPNRIEYLKLSPGTKVQARLTSEIDCEKVKGAIPITAVCAGDVCLDGKICVPENSVLSGNVYPAHFSSSPASINDYSIDFNKLTFPDGETTPLCLIPVVRAGELSIQRGSCTMKLIAGQTSKAQRDDSHVYQRTVIVANTRRAPASLKIGDVLTLQTWDYSNIPDTTSGSMHAK